MLKESPTTAQTTVLRVVADAIWSGKDCQVSHRPKHKADCQSNLGKDSWQPSWIRENRTPAFFGDGGPPIQVFGHLNYLWGNIPAFDVLNIKCNEGQEYAKDLDLCFAASGDLRNTMCSVNGLPGTYKGVCNVVLNDKNFNVAARNIIMLLVATRLPPADAAEVIVPLWYSARLTQAMLKIVEQYVKDPVAELVAKLQGKPEDVLLSKKWTYGASEVVVRLYKQQWTTLLQILESKHDVTKTEAERLKVVLAPSRVDYRDRELYGISGFRRICSTKFRESGVLAPFGSCLDQFQWSNPLLFNEKTSTWLQKDSASPLEGWSMQSIQAPSNLQFTAKNDLNGLLYFHVRTVIETFCDRIQDPSFKTHFILYCSFSGFDRIEVSNIADEFYLGLHRTLQTFASLIKPPGINHHAVLVTLFLNACEIADRMMGNQMAGAEQKEMMDQIMKYIHFDKKDFMKAQMNPASPEMFRFMSANDLVRDYDKIFEFYKSNMVNFSGAADSAGLKMREQNTIIDPWPMRLKKKAGEPGAEEEFKRLMESSYSGAERYVEWVRKK
ncbi:hypothetical protein G7Y79_00029g063940 [Physcia stellaris]|nr:hypothetical protein G7Y79_00029g063940 [Physcia stellaris]